MCYDRDCRSLEAVLCKDAYLRDFEYDLPILDSKEATLEHLNILEEKMRAKDFNKFYEPRAMKMSIKATKFVLK